MTKDILKLTSTFLNLDDVTNFLSLNESEPSEGVRAKISELLTLTNYVAREITKGYFPLSSSETKTSDEEGRIHFSKLERKAISVKDIKNSLGLSVSFELYPTYVKLETINSPYTIYYNYVPSPVTSIDEAIELPFGLDYFVVCFGVASEFCLSKGLYEEAQMWESKFLNSLSMTKPRCHERRFFARRLK